MRFILKKYHTVLKLLILLKKTKDTAQMAKEISGLSVVVIPSTDVWAMNADIKTMAVATYTHSLILIGMPGMISIKAPMIFATPNSFLKNAGKPKCLKPATISGLVKYMYPANIKLRLNKPVTVQ